MQRAFMSRRLFSRFLIAFSVFLLLVLALTLPSVLRNTAAIERNNLATYADAVASSLNQFDEQMASLLAILQRIGQSNADFRQICGPLDGPAYLTLHNMQQYLTGTLSGFSYARELVLLTRSDLILTRTRSFPPRSGMTALFFRTYLSLDGADSTDGLRALGSRAPLCLPIHSADHGAYDALMLAMPIWDSGMSRLADAFILVDIEALLGDIAPEDFLREGRAEVLARGETIYVAGTETLQDPVAIAASAESTGVEVVFTVPRALLRGGTTPIIRAAWVQLLASCLGGLALALFFAWHTGRPMRSLAQTVQALVPRDRESDEYAYVSRALNVLVRSLRQSQEAMDAQRRALQQNLLEKALLGSISSQTNRRDFASLLPDFPERYALVLLLLPGAKQADMAMDFALSKQLMVEHMLSEQFSTPMYHLSITPNLIALVMPDGAGGAPALERFQAAFTRQYQMPVNIFMSDWFTGPQMLGEAYSHAKRIQRYAAAYVEKRVWRSGNFPQREIISTMDYSVLQQLYEAASLGERETAVACLRRLRAILPDYSDDGRTVSALAFKKVLEFLHSILIRVKQEHFERLSHVQLLAPSLDQSLDDYMAIMEEYTCAISDEMARVRKERTTFGAEIVTYVDKHLTDPELYQKAVTSHFQITEKVLQAAMREATGLSFADYVEKQRLDTAYRLLTHTEASVAEISRQSGFALYNTFYKAFKRRYGCSPTEYRTRRGDEKNEKE